MKRFKTYGFWTAFAGAFIVFLNAMGDLFGFKIESQLVENLILAFAGVLVALGIVSMGKEGATEEGKIEEEVDENSALQQKVEEKTEDKSKE